MVDAGRLESGYLPLLTLLSMAAFLPISEISNVSRQWRIRLVRRAVSMRSTTKPVPVTDGDGVALDATGGGLPIELKAIDFRYEAVIGAPYTTRVSPFPQARRLPSSINKSGAGKTTIAHLLMRFWDPECGAIRLGGHDLRDYASTTCGVARFIAQGHLSLQRHASRQHFDCQSGRSGRSGG